MRGVLTREDGVQRFGLPSAIYAKSVVASLLANSKTGMVRRALRAVDLDVR